MDGQATKNLISFFQDIPDHLARNRLFRLIELFAIAVMGIICDAQDWTGMAAFGIIRQEWLATFVCWGDGPSYRRSNRGARNQATNKTPHWAFPTPIPATQSKIQTWMGREVAASQNHAFFPDNHRHQSFIGPVISADAEGTPEQSHLIYMAIYMTLPCATPAHHWGELA